MAALVSSKDREKMAFTLRSPTSKNAPKSNSLQALLTPQSVMDLPFSRLSSDCWRTKQLVNARTYMAFETTDEKVMRTMMGPYSSIHSNHFQQDQQEHSKQSSTHPPRGSYVQDIEEGESFHCDGNAESKGLQKTKKNKSKKKEVKKKHKREDAPFRDDCRFLNEPLEGNTLLAKLCPGSLLGTSFGSSSRFQGSSLAKQESMSIRANRAHESMRSVGSTWQPTQPKRTTIHSVYGTPMMKMKPAKRDPLPGYIRRSSASISYHSSRTNHTFFPIIESTNTSSSESKKTAQSNETYGTRHSIANDSNETMKTSNIASKTPPQVSIRPSLIRPKGKPKNDSFAFRAGDSFSDPFGSVAESEPVGEVIHVEIKTTSEMVRKLMTMKVTASNAGISRASFPPDDSIASSLDPSVDVSLDAFLEDSAMGASMDVQIDEGRTLCDDSMSVAFPDDLAVDSNGNLVTIGDMDETESMIKEKNRLAIHRRRARRVRPTDLPDVVALEGPERIIWVNDDNGNADGRLHSGDGTLYHVPQPTQWHPDYVKSPFYNEDFLAKMADHAMYGSKGQFNSTTQVDVYDRRYHITEYHPPFEPDEGHGYIPPLHDALHNGTTNDMSTNIPHWERKRSPIPILCSACFIMIIIGVVIGLVGSRGKNDDTQRLVPTASPSLRPSISPTFSDSAIALFLQIGMKNQSGELDGTASALQLESGDKALKWVLESKDTEILSNRQRFTQRFALATLYFMASGEKWDNNTGWLSDKHECTWFSSDNAPCDEYGSLTTLSLKYNLLVGEITTQIGLLTHLQQIELSGNRLSRSIPSEIGVLTVLQDVSLAANTFTGRIPTEMGFLTELSSFMCLQNQLEGSIPSELSLASNLRLLILSSNNLRDEIPSELGYLSNLEQLDLDTNVLLGTIPVTIGALTNLVLFSVRENFEITGTLPSEIADLSKLSIFDASFTQVNGTIPSELSTLQAVGSIFVLTSTLLTGSVPREVCDRSCCQQIPEFKLDMEVQQCVKMSCIYCNDFTSKKILGETHDNHKDMNKNIFTNIFKHHNLTK